MADLPPVLPIEPRDEPVEALVRPPGSKSLTNRALVVASLASGGASRLEGPLEADDTMVMREGLRALGVMIDDVDDPWLVLGSGGELHPASEVIDVGASGTTARFLTAVAALVPGRVQIDGTQRMRERPIGALADALEALGARVETNGGFPPLTVVGGTLRGGMVEVDARSSSQFLSAVLMIAPMLPEPLGVELAGGETVSRPYVISTLEVMRAFGGVVEETAEGFQVAPGGYRTAPLDIEADASAAAYPLVAAAILGGVVTIDGIPAGSTQADLRLVEVLEEMGCEVHRGAERLSLAGPAGRLRAVDVSMADAPDATLALAVACLFADGASRIRGLSTLRIKETDRLAALQAEIGRLGAEARIEGEDLVVVPGNLHGARVRTYDDHRMAMAFALVGLRVAGVEIDDPGCVSKTWPAYFDVLEAL